MKALSCILAVIVLLQANSVGGPKDGGWTEPLELPAGSPDNPSFKDLSKKVTFAGGQRACVIVTGRDGNKSPEADLKLVILDAKGNEVAGDHGECEPAKVADVGAGFQRVEQVRHHRGGAQAVAAALSASPVRGVPGRVCLAHRDLSLPLGEANSQIYVCTNVPPFVEFQTWRTQGRCR